MQDGDAGEGQQPVGGDGAEIGEHDGGDGARQFLHWYDTEMGLPCRFSEDTARSGLWRPFDFLIDGYAGIAGTLALWWLCGRFLRQPSVHRLLWGSAG